MDNNNTDIINVIKEQDKETLGKLFTLLFVQAINESEESVNIRKKIDQTFSLN